MVQVQQLEYNTHRTNRAEGAFQENKTAAIRAINNSAYSEKLWDYCAELQAKIRCHTAHDIPTINGQAPKTMVTGNTAYISELVYFGCYQWVYYLDAKTYFPLPEEEVVKYLGPSNNVVSKMSMWILKQNGEILSRTILRTIADTELASETEKKNRDVSTKAFNKKLGPALYEIDIKSYLEGLSNDKDRPNFTPYMDNEGIEEPTMPEADAIADYSSYI